MGTRRTKKHFERKHLRLEADKYMRVLLPRPDKRILVRLAALFVESEVRSSTGMWHDLLAEEKRNPTRRRSRSAERPKPLQKPPTPPRPVAVAGVKTAALPPIGTPAAAESKAQTLPPMGRGSNARLPQHASTYPPQRRGYDDRRLT